MERSVRLDAEPGEVWEALTRPELLSSWFGAQVEIEARRGGSVDARFPDGSRRRGIVQVAEPARRLSFRWRAVAPVASAESSVVELTLGPDGGGTVLTVVEREGLLGPEPDRRTA
jgi:uncharacterized protein YndB with AHSA1/START domain